MIIYFIYKLTLSYGNRPLTFHQGNLVGKLRTIHRHYSYQLSYSIYGKLTTCCYCFQLQFNLWKCLKYAIIYYFLLNLSNSPTSYNFLHSDLPLYPSFHHQSRQFHLYCYLFNNLYLPSYIFSLTNGCVLLKLCTWFSIAPITLFSSQIGSQYFLESTEICSIIIKIFTKCVVISHKCIVVKTNWINWDMIKCKL